MKRKNNLAIYSLLLTIISLIILLFLLITFTYHKICQTEDELKLTYDSVAQESVYIHDTEQTIAGQISKYEAYIYYNQQKQLTETQATSRERAAVYDSPAGPSIFSTVENDVFSDSSLTDSTAQISHVIGLDPGHQDFSVDMSALEPIGPGASETKVKSTTGTVGNFTSIPEYQLTLDISLMLKEELEKRGYAVIMTRTDNQTAISNKERAELISSQGAEIFVRIHANSSDSSSSTGAMTMYPSPDNPYVASLSEESKRLSDCILTSYCSATNFQNLGSQTYDNMTGINWSSVPVTILEMGFMSNEHDDTQMNNPSFQPTMIKGIADGIDAYFNN